MLVCHDETPYAQMHHRAFMAATATKKVSAHSSSIRGIPCTWAPSPAPDRHRSGRWSGVGKRRWKAGHMKRARNSESPRCAGGPFCQKCFRRPQPAPDCRHPEFRMMEAGATIRILCFARHCFRATSPPYPSTEVDFRKAQDRLAKPVQAGNPSSAGFLPIRRFRLSGWLHPFASPTATRALPP